MNQKPGTINILMVCLGNICRSPLAEGIIKHKLEKAGINCFVDSAGMISYHAGDAPDNRSIEVARKYEIDITCQRARKFSMNDFEKFDLIFAMDVSVYDEIISLTKNKEHHPKVHLLLEYAGYPEGSIVPDPYYGSKHDFEKVFKLIDDAGEKIAYKLSKLS